MCIPSPKDRTPVGRNVRRRDDGNVDKNSPMTGFRGSLFTSPTGLYAQFIPACFISSADASVMRSATSGEPAAASAIAPGLSTQRGSHQRNEDCCSLRTDNWVPASLLRASLNADTRPAAASSIVVSSPIVSHEIGSLSQTVFLICPNHQRTFVPSILRYLLQLLHECMHLLCACPHVRQSNISAGSGGILCTLRFMRMIFLPHNRVIRTHS